ncbi:MAG: decaprenyl-phosphate phosphoribosyltransferase [Deltaproteobacteria bacterium]|nr:decaprenyl-phosphate phosphoribosyltransferase [Deltaproteobacteria bacterium]
MSDPEPTHAEPTGRPSVASAPPSSGGAASDLGDVSLWRRLVGMVRTMRPHQWVKNLFVVAPVVFAKQLTDAHVIKGGIAAFAVFCMLASAVYTLNDLVDVAADRVHPVKRLRPIPSGIVPMPLARAMIGGLLVLSALGSSLVPPAFGAVALGYFVLNVAYSFKLKNVAYLDVGCIASGFVMRVMAGGFATSTQVSSYMIACTAALALFLGFGKRMHEIGSANATKQRAALQRYSPRVLLAAMSATGLASVATYVAYTLDDHTRAFFRSNDGAENWLWLTSVHPLVGVLRFVQLIRTRTKAESPTQEMLRDTPFMMNLVVWIVEVVVIVYRLRPT